MVVTYVRVLADESDVAVRKKAEDTQSWHTVVKRVTLAGEKIYKVFYFVAQKAMNKLKGHFVEENKLMSLINGKSIPY